MAFGGGSSKDPMSLSIPLVHQTIKEGYNRTIHNPKIIDGEVTKIYVIHGQSLASAWGGGTYVPTHIDKVDQINIEDGGCYAHKDPPLGCDSGLRDPGNYVGTWHGRFGDLMIDSGAAERIINIPAAVGGSNIAQFVPGGLCFERLLVAFRRAEALGYNVNCVLFQQGEAEAALGTTQSAYMAYVNAMISGLSDQGFNPKWMLAKSTVVSGVSYTPVRAAVDALVDGVDIYAGPDVDTLLGPTYRLADNTHLTATGLDTVALAFKNLVNSNGL